jgi:hypothetical protein
MTMDKYLGCAKITFGMATGYVMKANGVNIGILPLNIVLKTVGS